MKEVINRYYDVITVELNLTSINWQHSHPLPTHCRNKLSSYAHASKTTQTFMSLSTHYTTVS